MSRYDVWQLEKTNIYLARKRRKKKQLGNRDTTSLRLNLGSSTR